MIKITDIKIKIGTYNDLTFLIGDSEDVSSHTITMSVDSEKGKAIPTFQATDTSGIDMTDAATGTIIVNMTVADAASLGLGTFYADLRFEIGGKPEIWWEGNLTIEQALYVP